MAKAHDRALARYVAREVYAYSPFYRGRIDGAGLGRRSIGSADDLHRLPTTALGDVADPRSVVLRPDRSAIRSAGDPFLRAGIAWARFTGRSASAGERLDRMYKPVLWVIQGGLPIGSSSEDVERLSRLGGRWLESAGVTDDDVVVTLALGEPTLAAWQLVLGCQRLGVSALHLAAGASAHQVAALRPTVLAGPGADLLALLHAVRARELDLPELRTVLATGEPPDDDARRRLAGLVHGDVVVLAAWAPPGVRALWGECRGADGLHTWPGCEVVEVLDASGRPCAPARTGEVVWTALGWKGSAFLRLRTGARAVLDPSPCRHCRQTAPRLRVRATDPPLADVLSSHPDVAAWQAERRTVDGEEELIVFLAPSANGRGRALLRDLDRQLEATQFVVLDRAALDARVAQHDGRRIVDRRG